MSWIITTEQSLCLTREWERASARGRKVGKFPEIPHWEYIIIHRCEIKGEKKNSHNQFRSFSLRSQKKNRYEKGEIISVFRTGKWRVFLLRSGKKLFRHNLCWAAGGKSIHRVCERQCSGGERMVIEIENSFDDSFFLVLGRCLERHRSLLAPDQNKLFSDSHAFTKWGEKAVRTSSYET